MKNTYSDYPHALRFGIPSFDRLLGSRLILPQGAPAFPYAPYGFRLPAGSKSPATSICLVGPDGTGKSVFALHLASTYAYDCLRWQNHFGSEREQFPQILYVSTDLQFNMAESTWNNFKLFSPGERTPPFIPGSHRPADPSRHKWRVEFTEAGPRTIGDLLLQLPLNESGETASIRFVDLAARTAGDDWGFLHAMLASLPEPAEYCPRHLVVVDAIEGFETLTGENNAFGEHTSRRARVAQLMRLAAQKCHLALVVEEPREGERLAEEFVADAVVRFRADRTERYTTRTVEVAKARSQSHVRGSHPFVIREGDGSTTGGQENPDDPFVGHSYVQVFTSLNLVNRELMKLRCVDPLKPYSPHVPARFGIEFLDEMLGDDSGLDRRGLISGVPTSLIGDPGTEKTELGIAFLAEAVRQVVEQVITPGGQSIAREAKPVVAIFRQWIKLRNKVLDPKPRNGDKRSVSGVQGVYRSLAKKHGVTLPDPERSNRYTIRELHSHVTLLIRLLCEPEGIQIPVLITSQPFTVESLVDRFGKWLPLPKVFKKVRPIIEALTICRRMEIHHASAEAVFHIIRQCIVTAQSMIVGGPPDENDEERRQFSWRIRLVIDDLRNLQATYPDIGNDPIFLPSVVFHLETEGVTTLIIETHPARLDTPILDTFETKLRALVQRHIYTWQVPFYGERRISISVAPTPAGTPILVRELATGSVHSELAGKPSTPLYVDPQFELYSGLEEGRPRRIPAEVRLYAETSAFQEYVRDTNTLFSDVFLSRDEAGGKANGDVVVGVPTAEYEHLRDLCNLQRDAHLDHSLIFQVDEFWGLQKVTALREMNRYLDERTYIRGVPQHMRDPYGLFQPTQRIEPAAMREEYRRKDFFHLGGLELNPAGPILRVPFTWDFGFLMLKARAWEGVSEEIRNAFSVLEPEVNVSDVWGATRRADGTSDALAKDRDFFRAPIIGEKRETMHLPAWSWRAFFGAARIVAGREAQRLSVRVEPFDLSMIAPQSISCLVLEVWMSEILTELQARYRRSRKQVDLDQVITFMKTFHNKWDSKRAFGLDELVSRFKNALERALVLVAGAVDLETVFDADKPFGFRSRPANPSAIASRHWYKTAVEFQSAMSAEEPLTPGSLPGHYTTRGDWYLAVLRNSRSGRLADRVLDVLNSRRANVSRLQAGIGLPVRDLLPIEDQANWGFRTRLVVEHSGQRENVPLDRLCKLVPVMQSDAQRPPQANECYSRWLWRSDLKHFDRHSIVWMKWLSRCFRQILGFTLQGRDSYLKNFATYDFLVLADVMEKFKRPDSYPEGAAAAINWGKDNGLDLHAVSKAFLARDEVKFDELVKFLLADLQHCTPREE